MGIFILILIPILWSGSFFIFNFTILADNQNAFLGYIELGGNRVWWIAGCLIAARAFQSGDYL